MRRTLLRKVSAKRAKQIIKEKKLALRLYVKQDGKCAECHRSLMWDWRGFDLSHTTFKSHGGKSTEDNCQLLCRPCHSRLHGLIEK